jgi:hypothetical protein
VRGVLTIIQVDGAVSSEELAAPPALEDLQGGVGGYIELVPYFTKYKGRPCVAFCDEDGKRKGLPVNQRATSLWHALVAALRGRDVLVGPIVIITGDRELMEEL